LAKDPLGWWSRTFAVCEHDLVAGYCNACREMSRRRDMVEAKAREAHRLEVENARLRELLGFNAFRGSR
jgi:hypothetical protein